MRDEYWERYMDHEILTREAEERLGYKIKEEAEEREKKGNENYESRNKLVESNYKIVRFFARRYKAFADLEELIACGNLGLVKAADRFNPKKGKFSTYAEYHIRNEILQYFLGQDLISIPVRGRRVSERFRKIMDEESQEGIYDLSNKELIRIYEERYGEALTEEEVKGVRSLARINSIASLNKEVGREEGSELGDLIEEREQRGVEDEISAKIFYEEVKEIAGDLGLSTYGNSEEVHHKVLEEMLFEGKRIRELSREIGKAPGCIHMIYRRDIKILRNALREKGYDIPLTEEESTSAQAF